MRYDFRFLFNILVIGTILKYRKFILPSLILLTLIMLEWYILSNIISQNYETVSDEVLSYIMFISLFVVKVGNMVWLTRIYQNHKGDS